MIAIDQLIDSARQMKASDLHLSYQLPPMIRRNGSLIPLPETQPLEEAELMECAQQMMSRSGCSSTSGMIEESDFAYTAADGYRNRVNVYLQQKRVTIAIRLLNSFIPTMQELKLPPVFRTLTMMKRGLVLVTGPTGSGKSTTLAACINDINSNRHEHIITVEDPVEYIHQHKNCMIHQREVGIDTTSFAASLRSALREDPDILLVGEMRDLETISSAITAAETGHLVFSTLHTTGAAQTIDRIIDVFPPFQQQQIRTQLASVLKAVISQQLVPKADGSGRVVALEVLLVTDAVGNMIRENKCHQISSVMQTGAKLGMQSMDGNLYDLARSGTIARETAVDCGIDKASLFQRLQG